MAFDVSHLFSGLVGGLIAAGINYLGLRWRYRTDELAAFWARTCERHRYSPERANFVLSAPSSALGNLVILEDEAPKIDLFHCGRYLVDFFDRCRRSISGAG